MYITRKARRINCWVIFFIFILLLSTLSNSIYAENEKPGLYPWEISIGGVSYYISSIHHWNFGPELTIQRALSQTLGAYFTISYPSIKMTSRGYNFREGFPMDGGLWLSLRRVAFPVKLGAGLSYIFGSDSDGSELNGLGVHVSAHTSYWIKNHFGLWVRGVIRFWFGEQHQYSTASPSFSTGIGFRF